VTDHSEKNEKRAPGRVSVNEFANVDEMVNKRTDFNKAARFVQIAGIGDKLFALDEVGKVWLFSESESEWRQISDKRKSLFPKRPVES